MAKTSSWAELISTPGATTGEPWDSGRYVDHSMARVGTMNANQLYKAEIYVGPLVGVDKQTSDNWLMENATLKLPESADELPVLYTAGNHPFKTEEEYQRHLLHVTGHVVKKGKNILNVTRACQFPYQGQMLKFIGMESYRLTYVDFKKSKVQYFGELYVEPVFYFDAAEASRVGKLYELSINQMTHLFGNAPMEYLHQVGTELRRQKQFRDILADIRRKTLEASYENTELEFGSW